MQLSYKTLDILLLNFSPTKCTINSLYSIFWSALRHLNNVVSALSNSKIIIITFVTCSFKAWISSLSSPITESFSSRDRPPKDSFWSFSRRAMFMSLNFTIILFDWSILSFLADRSLSWPMFSFRSWKMITEKSEGPFTFSLPPSVLITFFSLIAVWQNSSIIQQLGVPNIPTSVITQFTKRGLSLKCQPPLAN